MTTEVDLEVKKPQAKKLLEPPEAGRDKKWIFSWGLWKECGPADTLIDFWPPQQ